MSKHLSSIKVKYDEVQLRQHLNEGSTLSTSNQVYQEAYKKHLLKEAMIELASHLSYSDEIRDHIIDCITNKILQLNDDKFNLKVIKLLSEELNSQLKEDIQSLIEDKAVRKITDYIEAKNVSR